MQSAPSAQSDITHRTELADFLRTRRARLRPSDVGLPRGARRRVAGLRLDPIEHEHLVWLTFVEPVLRRTMTDWTGFARCVIAHCRADSAAHAGDPDWTALIEDLAARSPELRDWWPSHEVAWPLLRPSPFRVVVYVPAPDTETARKLSTLSRIQDAEPVPG